MRIDDPAELHTRLSTPEQGCSVSVALDRSVLNGKARLERPSNLIQGLTCWSELDVGAFTYSWSHIGANVRSIGRYCSIAEGVGFGAAEHPVDWLSTSSFTYEPVFMGDEMNRKLEGSRFKFRPLPPEKKRTGIRIGNDVWIGAQAYIRGGVELGDGCIVGTGAIVTKDVAPYAVVAGNPARLVRERFTPDIVSRLRALAWWRYAFTDFAGIDPADVPRALDRLEQLIAGGLEPFAPPPAVIHGDGRRLWMDVEDGALEGAGFRPG